jgi:hypothetical protein
MKRDKYAIYIPDGRFERQERLAQRDTQLANACSPPKLTWKLSQQLSRDIIRDVTSIWPYCPRQTSNKNLHFRQFPLPTFLFDWSHGITTSFYRRQVPRGNGQAGTTLISLTSASGAPSAAGCRHEWFRYVGYWKKLCPGIMTCYMLIYVINHWVLPMWLADYSNAAIILDGRSWFMLQLNRMCLT